MRTEKRLVPELLIGFSIFICLFGAFANQSDSWAYTILHNFSGGLTDGSGPLSGGPVLSGSALYGMASVAGKMGSGVVFKINTDGTGYQILHNFGDPPGDGTTPRGSLAISASTLYGFTAYGGPPFVSQRGTVFKINTDGTGYQILHNFNDDPVSQAHPYGAPVISGAKLYGMTQDDSPLHGEIFSMNTDGTGFQVLHQFGGKPDDGALPYGSLTLVGSRLYGMTNSGGSEGISGGGGGYGVIFSLNADGTDYKILHNFAGYPNDGNNPFGSLTLVGGKLYGMTASGGIDNGNGVLFSINPDGTGYQVLLNFGTYSTGGPHGSLTFSGSKLFGMTSGGGPGGASGVIFRVNTSGSGFQILHSFMSSQGDGGQPLGDLTVSGSTLYGWTYAGGSSGGVIFSDQIPPIYPLFLPLLLND
jgi:uncharacterized repeat protein (TIGR03803 family)